MLLILEILLIAFAWKRGWKWWALLPLIIILGTAFIAGLDAAFTGIEGSLMLGQEDLPFIVKILVNVVFIVTMIAMIVHPRQRTESPKVM